MKNQEIITSAINDWLCQIFCDVMPDIRIPQNGVSSAISGLFGLDLSSYSLTRELSFLVPDLIGMPMKSYINDAISKLRLDDKDLPEYFTKIVNSCIAQCDKTGYPINLYGFQFEKKSFENLLFIYKEKKKN